MPAVKRYRIEHITIAPAQLVLMSYGPSFDEDGREETPEERAAAAALRARITNEQLHRIRLTVTDTHPPASRQTYQSPLVRPDELPAMERELEALAQRAIADRTASCQPS